MVVLTPTLAGSQQDSAIPSGVHSEILQVYDFQPHNLDKAGIAHKSEALDCLGLVVPVRKAGRQRRDVCASDARRMCGTGLVPSLDIHQPKPRETGAVDFLIEGEQGIAPAQGVRSDHKIREDSAGARGGLPFPAERVRLKGPSG